MESLAWPGGGGGSGPSSGRASLDQAVLPAVAAPTAAPTAAAHLARASLEHARQAQAAAQLAGADVPMLLEDLLPLEDLHDPFLELDQVELGGGAAPADLAAAPQHMSLHQMHAAAVAHGIDPSDPSALFSPSTTGFFGIPAYAEPDSPAAAAFNNSAGMLLAQQGSTPRVPGLPLHPGAFTAVHAFAAASSANDSHGLPPAIAAAQKRVAQQLQMQAQMQAQAQQAQQPAAQPQQPQPAQSLPVASALNAEAKACSSGAGGSHVSHGSADSGAAAATATTTATAPQYSAMQQCAVSDSSSGGADDHFEDAVGPAAAQLASTRQLQLTGSLHVSALTFTAGAAPAQASKPTPAKRGGRPREKKSYDDLIDPNLPPEEIRRMRRMLSNRESARRSRRRRQTQMSTLEQELEQLRMEREDLSSRLTQASSAMQAMAAEKAAMLAEIERLRMQVSQVSTGGPAPSPAAAAPPAPAPAAVLPAPTGLPAAMGLPLGVAPALPTCLSQLAEELSPADSLGAGRLPPLIEQAQRLAEKRAQQLRPQEELVR